MVIEISLDMQYLYVKAVSIGLFTIMITWFAYFFYADHINTKKNQESYPFSEGLMMLLKGLLGGIFFGYGLFVTYGNQDARLFFWITYFTIGLYFIFALLRKAEILNLKIRVRDLKSETTVNNKPNEEAVSEHDDKEAASENTLSEGKFE